MDSPFLASGVALPDGSEVWRVTFHTPHVKPLSTRAGSPARFSYRAADLVAESKPGFVFEPVVGGVMRAAVSDACSTRGYWVQRPSLKSLKIDDEPSKRATLDEN